MAELEASSLLGTSICLAGSEVKDLAQRVAAHYFLLFHPSPHFLPHISLLAKLYSSACAHLNGILVKQGDIM